MPVEQRQSEGLAPAESGHSHQTCRSARAATVVLEVAFPGHKMSSSQLAGLIFCFSKAMLLQYEPLLPVIRALKEARLCSRVALYKVHNMYS